jgi:tripartite ATP-independent transporter DctM subunit
MSPEIIGLMGIVVMLVLLFLRMWIGLSMALIGFLGYTFLGGIEPAFEVLGTVPYKHIAEYTFATIPLFTLMGVILYNSGIASDLFYSAYKWIGQLRGGLAIASAIASAVLGVVTDSLIAVITMGKVAVPEMRKYNYDDSVATSSIVGGASLASLIPPSIGFILYAILTEQSVGKLFMAAIIPGIILTILVILTIIIRARINPHLAPAGPKTSFKEKLVSLKYTWATGLLIVLIIAGIYKGVFTPTEAAGVGAFGALVIAAAGRRLTFRILRDSFQESTQVTAALVIVMMGAFVFMKFLAISKVSFMLGDVIGQLTVSRYIIFAAIMFLYLIFGMFTDIVASIILTMPIIYPIIIALGFDPIWYGVIIIIIIELGFITPPVGMNVFVLAGITGIPMGTIFRGIWPFVATLLICIVVLTVFPQVVLFLPNTM